MKTFPCNPKVGDYVGTALIQSLFEGCEGEILVGVQKTERGLKIEVPFRGTEAIYHIDCLKYERKKK